MRLGRMGEALELNTEIVASKESRGASALEISKARYEDHGALISLGRFRRLTPC